MLHVSASTFNCQEAVWSLLKRAFYKRLYRLDRDLSTQQQFKQLLQEVMEEVPICQTNLMRVNKRYVEFHADLRFYEDSYDSYEREAVAADAHPDDVLD